MNKILLALVLCFPVALAAQSADPPIDAPRRVVAVRIPNNRIQINGTLNESEWGLAMPAANFVQQQPQENAAASERSEVRFLYDDNNLYVGAMLYDSEPDKLITNELTRDFNARDGDLFVVVLDTFHDRTNSYSFQTNPGGAIRDMQSYEEGRTNNANWDTVWSMRTAVTPQGWIVEQAIPFKSIRFPVTEKQVWGLQLFRLIRRKNEQTVWSPVPRQFNQFKISYAGTLEGMEGIQPGLNFRVTPFTTANVKRQSGVTKSDADGGFDLKMGLGANLVLDATYRTDFSQVEADAQQVNLTRFSLFFPEKRQFFLENQGTFQMGPSAPNANRNSAQQVGPPDMLPFFSRTIGLSPETGQPIPIVGGVRLSGLVGRTLVGFMNIETEKETVAGKPDRPASNFTIARVGRQFLTNSSASLFYLGKERGDDANRLGGADFHLNLMRRMDIEGMWMRSGKTGIGEGSAWRSSFVYDLDLMRYAVTYLSLGNKFRDDMGFIPREGVDILTASALRRIRPRATYKWIREYRPEIEYSRYTRDVVGGVETRTVTPMLNIDFADLSQLSVVYRFNEEALASPFRTPSGYAVPVGRYRFQDGEINALTSRARMFSWTGGYRFGDYWNGSRRGFTAGNRIRFSSRLATTVSYGRDRLSLPGSSYATNLLQVRADASFSTRMFLNAFIQYNSQNHQVTSNIRFDFIHHPLSDLYVVYNEVRSTNGAAPASRALILKLTHTLSF